jgi:hypothetical protein
MKIRSGKLLMFLEQYRAYSTTWMLSEVHTRVDRDQTLESPQTQIVQSKSQEHKWGTDLSRGSAHH